MPFLFNKQPLALLYLLSLLPVVLLKLPYWSLKSLVPNWKPRRAWTLKRSLLVHIMFTFVNTLFATGYGALVAFQTKSKDAEKNTEELGLVHIPAKPDLIVGDIKRYADHNHITSEPVIGYWYGERKSGSVGSKALQGEKVYYHIHAGGFIMDTANPKKSVSANFLAGLLEHGAKHVKRIFAIEYRLASSAPYKPAAHFPAAVIDVIAGYSYLVDDLGFEPNNIIVGGDSAGGAIAQALVRYLVHAPPLPNGRLAPPGGLLMVSATIDLGHSYEGNGNSLQTNASIDFSVAFIKSGYSLRSLLGSLPESEFNQNPYLAPGSSQLLDGESKKGLFNGFPRTCVIVGDTEVMLTATQKMAKAIADDIGSEKVLYIEGKDCTHCYVGFAWHEPERTETLVEVGRWIDSLF